jgi:hypothetical protein
MTLPDRRWTPRRGRASSDGARLLIRFARAQAEARAQPRPGTWRRARLAASVSRQKRPHRQLSVPSFTAHVHLIHIFRNTCPSSGAMSSTGGASGAGAGPSAPNPTAVAITEEVALQHLDEAALQLQKEQRYLEALECMERGLVLRQRMFGPRSEEVRSCSFCDSTQCHRGRVPCREDTRPHPAPVCPSPPSARRFGPRASLRGSCATCCP